MNMTIKILCRINYKKHECKTQRQTFLQYSDSGLRATFSPIGPLYSKNGGWKSKRILSTLFSH